MSRYALELGYDGSEFAGWQSQPNVRTIQSELQKSLSIILREEIKLAGCGRTDTGVHAKNFIAHFDCQQLIDDLIYKLNKMLPECIGARRIYAVPDDFNSRFDALSRTYLYRISKQKDPFEGRFVYWDRRSYDMAAMNAACDFICTQKDFGAFCKQHSQNKTNNCDVEFALWAEFGNELQFKVKANRFLRNMVRAMVGTLLDVGLKRIDLKNFQDILASGKRSLAGRSVPAQGLTLLDVEYDRTNWIKVG